MASSVAYLYKYIYIWKYTCLTNDLAISNNSQSQIIYYIYIYVTKCDSQKFT